MGAAVRALDLRARHTVLCIGQLKDVLLAGGLVVAGPSGAGLKLRLGVK